MGSLLIFLSEMNPGAGKLLLRHRDLSLTPGPIYHTCHSTAEWAEIGGPLGSERMCTHITRTTCTHPKSVKKRCPPLLKNYSLLCSKLKSLNLVVPSCSCVLFSLAYIITSATVFNSNRVTIGWGCGCVVEPSSTLCEALGLFLSTAEIKSYNPISLRERFWRACWIVMEVVSLTVPFLHGICQSPLTSPDRRMWFLPTSDKM